MARGRSGGEITRLWKEARARGERTFDAMTPCVNGHLSPRWTNNGICVECKRARDNAYNLAHAEEHRARSKRSADSRPEAVKAYAHSYYLRNADVAKERAKLWEKAHPERVRERSRQWYKDNALRLRPLSRARHAANPHRHRTANRAWKLRNIAHVRAADSLRRAREVGAAVGDRKAYRVYVAWARTAARVRCYWCKRPTKPGPKTRHIDHIIPLAKGGADAVANLCVSCPACNLQKNSKMPEDYAGNAELRLA